MEEINNVYKKQKKNLSSIIFLVIVIIMTGLLHIYNNSLTNDIAKIKIDINSYNNNIKEVEKNKKIQIYTLLQLNNSVIRGYKLMNKIPLYINHFKDIERKYNVKFNGFSLNNLGITTTVEVVSDNKSIAFQKTRDFLKKYRLDKDALFNLEFVNQIQGMDKMRFKVHFKIKG